MKNIMSGGFLQFKTYTDSPNEMYAVMHSRHHSVNSQSVIIYGNYSRDNEQNGYMLDISTLYALGIRCLLRKGM